MAFIDLAKVSHLPPVIKVGSLSISGNLFLAPMDGVTDSAFRTLARRLGSAASFTEFINANDVLFRFSYVQKRLNFREEERPIIFQLYDNEPERIIQAALKLFPLQPDAIDINMGCSASSISNRGAGAGLLKNPQKIATIFSTLSKTLTIPITGKIRLGWDENHQNYLDISHIIEDNGGKLISVHARTQKQKYSGAANWQAIAEIKSQVSIPVIGNGDILTSSDVTRMTSLTNCDGVMIGRAVISNPWLFSGYDRHEVPVELVRDTIQLHYNLLSEDHGPYQGLVLLRKFVNRYLAPYQLNSDLRKNLLTQTEPALFFHLLDKILDQNVIKIPPI